MTASAWMCFHKSGYPELRVYLDKQRNVVGDDFQSQDLGSISQSRLRYQIEGTLGNLIHKHFTTHQATWYLQLYTTL